MSYRSGRRQSAWLFLGLALASPASPRLRAEESVYVMKNCSQQDSIAVPVAPLQSYVQRVATRLFNARTSERVPTQVLLLTGDFQACAVRQQSQGNIFVQTGLLQFARNEAELAGVLAHEIGHIELNHFRTSAKSQATEALFSFLAGFMASRLDSNPQLSGLASSGAKVGNFLLQTRFRRDQEHEADRFGVQLAARAGYDATASYSLFSRLAEEQPHFSGLQGLEMNHPLTPTRLEHIRGVILQMPASARASYSVNPEVHALALRAMARIAAPLDQLVQQVAARRQPEERSQLRDSAAEPDSQGGVEAAFERAPERQTRALPPPPQPRLGVNIRMLNDQQLASMGLRPGAPRVQVQAVNEGSFAERVGLRGGDLLQSINGAAVTGTAVVLEIVGRLGAGARVQVDVVRLERAAPSQPARWYSYALRGIWP